ncbi:cupin domain-containing protein [Streptomyces rugosispiralis]|uniref:Cupin domain-containing protein n=1 Tax=Streptomyces rugosispiralis TaxID=2967341 RepID=A0ABT1V768_9ACTN|nr:cupin domain-containing protein [Streptomyces rugosispiralis]MCQ8192615.1 cupin domain-containing protein [Streptomyces rugosispiralis]
MSSVALIPTTPDVDSLLKPSDYIDPANLRTAVPAETAATHLASADEKFSIGTWRAEPYAEYIEAYPGDEYTRIIEGRVTLTQDDGTTWTFGPGDAFTIAAGWRGEYRVDEPLLKQFAYYIP